MALNRRASTALAALLVCQAPQAALAHDMRVYVDPEVRVSYDGDALHMEAPVAASPDDPDTLYAASELLFRGRPPFASEARIFVSRNGGGTWTPTPLQALATSSWDNAIAAGPNGAAYFISHAIGQPGLTVYRTTNSGDTWTPVPFEPQKAGAWDREYAVVDATDGPYRGRAYIAGNYNQRIGVAHSTAAGDAFVVVSTGQPSGPVRMDSAFSHTEGSAQMEAGPGPVVLSDGTLVVAVRKYPDNREKGPLPRGIGVIVSRDGGETFAPYVEIAAPLTDNARQGIEDVFHGALIAPAAGFTLAAAPKGTAHQDRLYAVWTETLAGPTRRFRQLRLSRSDDKGANWSAPQVIGSPRPSAREAVDQAWPMLAVNRDGVVGVAWFDNRHSASGRQGYDIYFTASLDGGSTFEPERRVTTVTSYPASGLNAAPVVSPSSGTGILSHEAVAASTLFVTNNYMTRQLGGDYVTMAVDAAGRFHPLWQDTRDGGWQLYTSTIRVVSPPIPFRPASAADCKLDTALEVIAGESRYDPDRGEAVVQLRLRNRSARVFASPIIMRQTQRPDDDITRLKNSAPLYDKVWETPEISTGDAFAPASEARINLDSERPLFPGGVTAWTTWRYKVANPASMLFSTGISLRLDEKVCGAS